MKNKIRLLPLILTFIAIPLVIYYGNIPKPIKIPQHLGIYSSTTNDSIILIDLNNTAIIAIDEDVNTYIYEILWGNNESESNYDENFELHHWEVNHDTKEIKKQILKGYRYIQFIKEENNMTILHFGIISVAKFDTIIFDGMPFTRTRAAQRREGGEE